MSGSVPQGRRAEPQRRHAGDAPENEPHALRRARSGDRPKARGSVAMSASLACRLPPAARARSPRSTPPARRRRIDAVRLMSASASVCRGGLRRWRAGAAGALQRGAAATRPPLGARSAAPSGGPNASSPWCGGRPRCSCCSCCSSPAYVTGPRRWPRLPPSALTHRGHRPPVVVGGAATTTPTAERSCHHRQRDPHPGRPAGAARAAVRRRDPQLLGAEPARQAGPDPRPHDRRCASGRPRRATTAASAPSSAASSTRTWRCVVVAEPPERVRRLARRAAPAGAPPPTTPARSAASRCS